MSQKGEPEERGTNQNCTHPTRRVDGGAIPADVGDVLDVRGVADLHLLFLRVCGWVPPIRSEAAQLSRRSNTKRRSEGARTEYLGDVPQALEEALHLDRHSDGAFDGDRLPPPLRTLQGSAMQRAKKLNYGESWPVGRSLLPSLLFSS